MRTVEAMRARRSAPDQRDRSFSHWLRAAIALIAFACVAASCGITETIDNAVAKSTNAMDRATERLATESDQMQVIFDDLAEELGDEASVVVAEVEAVASRVISTAATEFRCSVDFVRDRARQDLIHIRNEVVSAATLSLYKPTPPPRFPVICAAPIPNVIRQGEVPDTITLSGYDLDAQDLQFLIENSSGETRDITAAVAISTKHYVRTIPFGQNAVQLGPDDRRIVLAVGDDKIAEVSIIKPTLPACATEIDWRWHPDPLDVVPTLLKGSKDAEFDGNGPWVELGAMVKALPTGLTGNVWMRAEEMTDADDATRAYGLRVEDLAYPLKPGWKITGLGPDVENSPLELGDHRDYKEYGTTEKQFPGTGPVEFWTVVGDTHGPDVEAGTRLTVTFKPFGVQLMQVDGCE